MKTSTYQYPHYRNFHGETIALWKNTVADPQGNCMSYQHCGQHGAANFQLVMSNSTPASQQEIATLKQELLDIGYEPDRV